MSLAVIVGANRGIGLGLAKELVSQGHDVYATTRKPSSELNSLGAHVVEGVEIATENGIVPLKKALAGKHIDLLILNAAVLNSAVKRDGSEAWSQGALQEYNVNVLGPIRVVHALLDNLGQGSRVAIITSALGSNSRVASAPGLRDIVIQTGADGYAISKAAVNMAGTLLASTLQAKGAALGLIHPGLVDTDMAKEFVMSKLTTAQSASAIVAAADKITLDNTGTFWDAPEGDIIPW